jgi:hypothetical protein
VVTAASLYATLPSRFIGGSGGVFTALRFLVPALALVLMAPLAMTAPRRRIVYSIPRRTAAIGLIAVITAANGTAVVLLVHLLVTGHKVNGHDLIRAAIHIWCANVIVFALWFWQLDSGGPMARWNAAESRPGDFLFRSRPTRRSREPAGGRRSSTTSTSRSRTRPRSARPTRCR